MARFIVLVALVATLAACTSTPPPAAPTPDPAVAADGSDPCLDELLKSAEASSNAPPAPEPAPMTEPTPQ